MGHIAKYCCQSNMSAQQNQQSTVPVNSDGDGQQIPKTEPSTMGIGNIVGPIYSSQPSGNGEGFQPQTT